VQNPMQRGAGFEDQLRGSLVTRKFAQQMRRGRQLFHFANPNVIGVVRAHIVFLVYLSGLSALGRRSIPYLSGHCKARPGDKSEAKKNRQTGLAVRFGVFSASARLSVRHGLEIKIKRKIKAGGMRHGLHWQQSFREAAAALSPYCCDMTPRWHR